MTQFFNGNPRGTSITSLHLINQDVGGIILTGAGVSFLSLVVVHVKLMQVPNS